MNASDNITFNVIIFNFNSRKFEYYDILPYFIREYKERELNLSTFEEFKEFILREAQYQFWARCEYEIILQGWPCTDITEKWDVYDQIKMNIDIITQLFISVIKK